MGLYSGGGLLCEGFLRVIFGCLYSGDQELFSAGGGGVSSEFHGMTTHCDLILIPLTLIVLQFWMIKMKVSSQPRPQGLRVVQNGGSENPWPRLLKYSRIVEDFVTWRLMKWLFRRLFPVSGSPVCFFVFL